jgi:hypothetical protein
MPYTTERDLAGVAEMCAPAIKKKPVNQVDSRSDSMTPSPGLRELERATGIAYSALRRHYKEGKSLSAADRSTLDAYLRTVNQVESGRESSESRHKSADESRESGKETTGKRLTKTN